MKYLKRFEDNEHYDVGDYIKCVFKEGYHAGLSIGTVYKIEGFKIDNTTVFAVIHNDNNKTGWYKIIYFIEATTEEIEQYELEQKANKYNL